MAGSSQCMQMLKVPKGCRAKMTEMININDWCWSKGLLGGQSMWNKLRLNLKYQTEGVIGPWYCAKRALQTILILIPIGEKQNWGLPPSRVKGSDLYIDKIESRKNKRNEKELKWAWSRETHLKIKLFLQECKCNHREGSITVKKIDFEGTENGKIITVQSPPKKNRKDCTAGKAQKRPPHRQPDSKWKLEIWNHKLPQMLRLPDAVQSLWIRLWNYQWQ